ncbi:siderophore-interacting protein [Timonella sp. A28]|uniref:siderophore-interacting protein n=1 Tax=Timonella sp. A28 TaxID=3442640 RepID=UPI003EBF302B
MNSATMTLMDSEVHYPSYRPYHAHVVSVTQLSPHFTRVRFTGPEFNHFAEHALDQRVKIVFPHTPNCYTDLGLDNEESLIKGDWYERWRALPDDQRSPFRTYTVRTINAATKTLDIDFVIHHDHNGPTGPGGAWIHTAQPGDTVIIVGPDARSSHSHIGIDFRPGTATNILLMGDETAAPAIAGILEKLPTHIHATAFIEVPATEDTLDITTHPHTTITYLPRNGLPVGTLLLPALHEWADNNQHLVKSARSQMPQPLEDINVDAELLWESPEVEQSTGLYAWLAGESSAIKRMRRYLVSELGVDRKRVAFMGYWRAGQAERIS